MAETLHKGWLETRDGSKFAPATLSENIYNRDGTKYDESVQKKIDDSTTTLSTAIMSNQEQITANTKAINALQQQDSTIADALKNIDASDSNTLYIIDDNNNIIAKIDANGISSTNFNIPIEGIDLLSLSRKTSNDISALTASVSQIIQNTKYFDGSSSDTFYVIDDNNNIIMKVDKDGVKSVNFSTNEADLNTVANDLSEETKARQQDVANLQAADEKTSNDISALTASVSQIIQNTKYFDGSSSDTFYIADDENHIIMKVNADGATSIDFIAQYQGENGETINAKLVETYKQSEQNEQAIAAIKDDAINYDTLGKVETWIEDTYSKQHDALSNAIGNNTNAHEDIAVYLNGQVNGTGFITEDNDIQIETTLETLTSQGVYGPSTDKTLDFKENNTFFVPYVAVDEHGRVSEAATKTIELPSIDGLEKAVGELISKTECIDASDGEGQDNNTLYITDNNNNIIMKVDSNGVSGYNFIVPNLSYENGNRINANDFISVARLVDTLSGDKTVEGSVAYQIAQIIADADADFDTLKEIADWIINHPNDVQTIVNSINKVKEAHEATKIALSGSVLLAEGTGTLDDEAKTLVSQIDATNNLITLKTKLSDSGVNIAENGYGNNGEKPEETKQLSFESEFKVPYFKVQSDGRVTEALDYTLKLPDTKAIENSITNIESAHKAIKVKLTGDIESVTDSKDEGFVQITNANEIVITTNITDIEGLSTNLYGSTETLSPKFGEGFQVPYFKPQSDGRIEQAGLYTVTLPSVQGIINDISNLKSKTECIDASDGESPDDNNTLYVIDGTNDKNIIMKVNNEGITTTNVTLQNGLSMQNNVMFFEAAGSIDIAI